MLEILENSCFLGETVCVRNPNFFTAKSYYELIAELTNCDIEILNKDIDWIIDKLGEEKKGWLLTAISEMETNTKILFPSRTSPISLKRSIYESLNEPSLQKTSYGVMNRMIKGVI